MKSQYASSDRKRKARTTLSGKMTHDETIKVLEVYINQNAEISHVSATISILA